MRPYRQILAGIYLVLLSMLRAYQEHVEERHDKQPVISEVGVGEFEQAAETDLSDADHGSDTTLRRCNPANTEQSTY